MLRLVSKYTSKETTEKKNFMWNMVGAQFFQRLHAPITHCNKNYGGR